MARKKKDLSALYKVVRKITSFLSLDQVLRTLIEETTLLFNSEITSVMLLDEESNELVIEVAKGLAPRVVRNTRIKMGERISGWVAKHGKAILVKDVEKDPRFRKRSQEKYYTKSLISAPIKGRKGKVIGVVNVNNKKTRRPFTKNDLEFLQGLASQAAIAIENARLYENLHQAYLQTIRALATAIDTKDHYTYDHSEHVTKYAIAIAEELGISKREREEIKEACQLHDIGKIGIHDRILTKPGKLTEEEWKEIKLHPRKGADILEPLDFLSGVVELVREHHERYNGKGYPNGIKGQKITLGARVMAVADAFDAMTSERPYRGALSRREAIEELKKQSGSQFDPRVLKAFLEVLKKKPRWGIKTKISKG